MKFVSPRLQGRIDDSSPCTSEFCVQGGADDLEFLHRILIGRHEPASRPAVGFVRNHRRAVQQELVVAGPATAHGVVVVGIPPARPGITARAELRLQEHHARRQLHQHVNLAPIQRQVLDLLKVHRSAAGSVRCIHDVGRGAHEDLLYRAAQLKREVQFLLLGHAQRDIGPNRPPKACRVHRDLVLSWNEVRNHVETLGIRCGRGGLPGVLLHCLHLGVRDHRSAGVPHNAGKRRAKLLATCRRHARQHPGQHTEIADPRPAPSYPRQMPLCVAFHSSPPVDERLASLPTAQPRNL